MPDRARSRSPRRGRRPSIGRPALTSTPTGRGAYEETRQWLLKRHGPVCAYCDTRVIVRTITLDHVTPRRGQTAYDRRDNLVLSCGPCNTAKADKSILAFLLGRRTRATSLFKYGQHLSPMLVEMARQFANIPADFIAPDAITARAESVAPDDPWGMADDGASPYSDHTDSPYLD